jgi:hypothetical protein
MANVMEKLKEFIKLCKSATITVDDNFDFSIIKVSENNESGMKFKITEGSGLGLGLDVVITLGVEPLTESQTPNSVGQNVGDETIYRIVIKTSDNTNLYKQAGLPLTFIENYEQVNDTNANALKGAVSLFNSFGFGKKDQSDNVDCTKFTRNLNEHFGFVLFYNNALQAAIRNNKATEKKIILVRALYNKFDAIQKLSNEIQAAGCGADNEIEELMKKINVVQTKIKNVSFNMTGGAKLVLGRFRKITKQGRQEVITLTLKEARALEKKLQIAQKHKN